MIDRSYLPFASAREYQDRGMLKWMGFFLSEHTSAIKEDHATITFTSDLDVMQRATLIGQCYASGLQVTITVKEGNTKATYTGIIMSYDVIRVSLKAREQYHHIALEDILDIKLSSEEGVVP